jgi:hypothetical protein
MTKDREEQLIGDVAASKAMLETFFSQVVPTLATKQSVEAVDKKLEYHIAGHVSNRGLVASYVGVIVALAGSTFAFLRG